MDMANDLKCIRKTKNNKLIIRAMNTHCVRYIILIIIFSFGFKGEVVSQQIAPALKALDVYADVYARKGINGRMAVNIEIMNKGEEKIIIINEGVASSFFSDLYIAAYDHSDKLFYEVDYEPFVDKYNVLNSGDIYRKSFPIFTEYKGVERANILMKCKKIVVKIYFYAASETAKIKKNSGFSNIIEKQFIIDPIHFDDDHLPDPGDDNR